METDFPSFHDDLQFSTNSILSSDEMMKDQLRILESIKTEDSSIWPDDSVLNESALGKEDFQHIMSEWQNHVGSLQIPEPENIDISLGLLGTSDLMFDERSPILTKTLNGTAQKLEHLINADAELLGIKKEDPIFENDPCDTYLRNPSEQRFLSRTLKTEPTVVRKLSLLNGEREILGKNIIGLHSLNEIQENPDQNCQVTSTVINGKRYKIIIKPKSQKVKKFTKDKIRKTLIKKLSRCNIVLKTEPKEDEIISEMRNGNYDVPILGNDLISSWDMNFLDTNFDNASENSFNDEIPVANETDVPKKVPPLRIKIPKNKKCKKKRSEVESDEEIDVETVVEQSQNGGAKEIMDEESGSSAQGTAAEEHVDDTLCSNQNILNSLPKDMVDRIESLKRKKDGRIPLVQVIPVRKHVGNGTRMQDAAATINRNKLLKIVSGGDTVQLDHDYCSNSFKNVETTEKKHVVSDSDTNLSEKNPKKDSGMESGDVSDASEEPQTPETVQNMQSIQDINNKLLEQRRNGRTTNITKVAAAFFRAANAITSNTNNSDVVKTLVVSNGNKALTNGCGTSSNVNGDNSDIVPSGSENCSSNDSCNKIEGEGENNKSCVESSEQAQISHVERPKKKLKLEEYLSRRIGKGVDGRDSKFGESDKNGSCKESKLAEKEELINSAKNSLEEPNKDSKENRERDVVKEESSSVKGSENGKKSRVYRRQRSSSSSSGERDTRRDRDRSSRSRSSWRSSRRDSRTRRRYRASTSSERRRSFWSRSRSRPSSRESSTSSDRSAGRRKRTLSPVWYRRRSRSRSISRERSRSRNRSYSNMRRQNHYFNRNFYDRRSKSPYHSYSMREKQRQIEERRVIYIGRIEDGMTNAKLRERFSVFGPIVNISLHFREYGDNYGFVTYAYKDDAYDAVEHGNDDPNLPHYDLCFGGRRGFCKERYADLDGMPTSYSGFKDTPIIRTEESFDLLLKKAQAKLKKRIRKNSKT